MQAISLRALTLSSITAFKVGGDDLSAQIYGPDLAVLY
jgi:hypothetical protein